MMSQQSVPPWAYQVSKELDAELEQFNNAVELFKHGELSEEQFRGARVPFGIYEQRESGSYVLRVRLPAGSLLPGQLRCVATLADSVGNGTLHFSTRQDVQVHGVRISALLPALKALVGAGLACKGSGGNTVRNVTTCHRAGVCSDELFDVTPYAIALTERLMSDPDSFQLPRKYKIAFSGCPTDCAGIAVADLGFIARHQAGADGFAVYVGGGLGKQSRLGDLLHEFIPAEEVYCVAEAVKRMFGRYGDRKNKNLARLRFVVRRFGFEHFRELYQIELDRLRASGPLRVRSLPQRVVLGTAPQGSPQAEGSEDYWHWRSTSVRPQKQPGFFEVEIVLALGDLRASTALELANIVLEHGDGVLRAHQAQNVSMRWLTEEELPVLHAKLHRLGLACSEPTVLRNVVTCAGAATCQPGICRSRDLALAVSKRLQCGELNGNGLEKVRIHISGCPNSCGRHQIADIGLHGGARRTKTGLAPYYTVSVGGCTREGAARLAEECGAVPAKRVPEFLLEVLRAWDADDAQIGGSVESARYEIANEILERYLDPPALETGHDAHSDWGSDAPFSLVGRGQGECGAGPEAQEPSEMPVGSVVNL